MCLETNMKKGKMQVISNCEGVQIPSTPLQNSLARADFPFSFLPNLLHFTKRAERTRGGWIKKIPRRDKIKIYGDSLSSLYAESRKERLL